MVSKTSKNLSKDSTKDRPGITERIQDAIRTYPNSKAKAICRLLKIDYNRYKGMVWIETHRIKKYNSTKVPGQPRSIPDHKSYYTLDIDGSTFALLCNEADRNSKDVGRFYRSNNWNRQIMFIAPKKKCTIWVYPRSQSCRVLRGKNVSEEDLRYTIESAFLTVKEIHWSSCEKIANTLLPSNRSRTFTVPVYNKESWDIDYYMNSLGILIKGDKSHRRYVEVDETYPRWIKDLVASNVALARVNLRRAEAEKAYAKNLETHTEVMLEIKRLLNSREKKP